MELGPLDTPPWGGSNAATIQEGSLSYINQTSEQLLKAYDEDFKMRPFHPTLSISQYDFFLVAK